MEDTEIITQEAVETAEQEEETQEEEEKAERQSDYEYLISCLNLPF